MDELDGVVGGNLRIVAHVGIVLVLLDVNQTVAVQAIVGIVIRRIGVDGGDGPAVELVEATVVGRRLRVVAVEVPLVDQTGAVACLRHDRAQRDILGQQVSPAHDGGIAVGADFQARQSSGVALVVADAGVAAVAARHQRTAAGRTDAAAGVGLRKRCARTGQPVDVRRLDVLVAVASQVAVAHIVGQDKDDVRTLVGSHRLLCQQGTKGHKKILHIIFVCKFTKKFVILPSKKAKFFASLKENPPSRQKKEMSFFVLLSTFRNFAA